MAASGSPTVRRRRLAAELRRLRGNRTGVEVSRGVGWSTSKISRAESGRETLPPAEVEKLIDFYGVADPLRARLLALAEDATQRGWWENYADSLTPEYMEFIGLEAEASSVLHWQSDVVPGLLQTAAYSRQLNKAFRTIDPTIPPSAQERFLEVRQVRQERLTQEPVLQLTTVIDEAVLLRGVGDRAVSRDQLAHLVQAAERPNIDLRILPLDRDIALGAVASFAILRFGSAAETGAASLGDVVSTESLDVSHYVEGDVNTHLFQLFFDAVRKAALTPAKSRDLIVTTSKHVWS
jgi:hypothetical protein